MVDLFYIQDSRSYVGNDMLFWREGGKGYTTDLSKAGVFPRENALQQNASRETDIPWPKDYIDARTRPAVDFQVCKREDLKGYGIALAKLEKLRKPVFRCSHCGIFMKERQQYEPCPRCDGDNMP